MENQEPIKKKKSPALFIVPVVVLLLLFFGIKKFIYLRSHEDTENAQVECNISPVLPKISGYITAITFRENQVVNKGDTLVTLDDRELKIKVTQADLALQNAVANLDIIKSNISTAGSNTSAVQANAKVAQANYENAQIKVAKLNKDFERVSKLLSQNVSTQQQFDNIKAEKESAEKLMEVARLQIEATKDQSSASTSQLSSTEQQNKLAALAVKQKQEELDFAKLQLSYAYVIAPTSGFVSKKNIQLGQFVNAGQALFAIANEDDMWVIANFKETQLEKMKVGQAVEIKIDTYTDKKFEGKIESFSAATGARFALLPPDNATGNFVKVTQRVPVKILFSEKTDAAHLLRAGMSAEVAVSIN